MLKYPCALFTVHTLSSRARARTHTGLVLAGLGYYLWSEVEQGESSSISCTLPMSGECAAAFSGTAILGFPARRILGFLYAVVFTWRVMVQMLYFWHRKVSWVEVIFEAGGVIPLSLVRHNVSLANLWYMRQYYKLS